MLKQNYCFILEENLTFCSRSASPNLTYSAHMCTLLTKRMHIHFPFTCQGTMHLRAWPPAAHLI